MFSNYYLESNWKKVLCVVNVVFAVVVGVCAYVDIHFTQISSLMSILRLLQFIVIAASAIALFRENDVNWYFYGKILNADLDYIRRGDVQKMKLLLEKSPEAVNYVFMFKNSLLGNACVFGHTEMAQLILSKGASVLELSTPGRSPLMEAAISGNEKTYDIVRKTLSDEQFSALCHKTGLSELHFACFEGNFAKVEKLLNKNNVNQTILEGITPLHMAVLGKRDRRVIEKLMSLGADHNAFTHKISDLRTDSVNFAYTGSMSPSLIAVAKKDEELAIYFFEHKKGIVFDGKHKDHVMVACELGLANYVSAVLASYDWTRRDSDNKSAIDYADDAGHIEMLRKLRTTLQQAAQSAEDSIHSKENIEMSLSMSLSGMVGVDNLVQNLSHELTDFLKKQPGESKGIVLWGDASVGKTELGQRLAGLKQSFNIPGLNLDKVSVKYIACCDGQIDIAKEVASAPPKSIIILDEIDKFFNPKSGIVDDAQAKKLRTSIVTNFQQKPLFWVFAGTFHDLRGMGRLNEKDLSQVLGTELTSRLDFADWQLPSWTLESMLAAAQNFLNQDQKVVSYDDEGMVVLVQQALTSGGGVRQLQKYHDYFKRKASKNSAALVVTKQEAQEYMKML